MTYLDFLGSVSVLERVVCVLVGEAGGRDIRDHDGPAVAADRVLQQTGQLGVPIRDVLGSFGQRVDAVS